jgi:hypothetical protein
MHPQGALLFFHVTVSGLALNFVSDHRAMVRKMERVTKGGGEARPTVVHISALLRPFY